MENISDVAYETLRTLIIESEWGKSVTNKDLFGFLFSEIYEFIDGCNKYDMENILEEASDVLMILLYIVIKNTDSQNNNQIDELIYRLNKKLRYRYSVYFDENDNINSEEQYWLQAKYIEKEILSFLYCPVPNCPNYAKTQRGNIILEGEQVRCISCGYISKCNSSNIILYNSKHRRNLLETLDNNFLSFLRGSLFFADYYFNNNREDYLKVMRYYFRNAASQIALKDFFISRHKTNEDDFDEFLIYPLRNYINSIINDKPNLTHSIIEINDLMIKLINANYTEIRNKICANCDSEYMVLWTNYIRYLIKSMTVPVEYKSDNISLLEKEFTGANNKKQLSKSYSLYVVLEDKIKIPVYLNMEINKNDREKTIAIEADLLACRLITQVAQVLLSVVIKFNLQNQQKIRCVFSNVRKTLNSYELSEFLRNLLPVILEIAY